MGMVWPEGPYEEAMFQVLKKAYRSMGVAVPSNIINFHPPRELRDALEDFGRAWAEKNGLIGGRISEVIRLDDYWEPSGDEAA
ncbi:MAG: hypothetical protein ACYS8L_07925 [Planctomycetota bacterium]